MESKIKLLWNTQDPEYQIVRASRICYGSEDKIDSRWEPTEHVQNIMVGKGLQVGVPLMKVKLGPSDEQLLKTIMKNQHNTCLRFASAAFNIKDVSHVCSHQLVRIAHFGILQRSQRYCDDSNVEFSFPAEIKSHLDTNTYIESCKEMYKNMIKAGIKKEDARYVLPSASVTELNMVSNFQGWKHFLNIRLAEKVQKETREVAIEICKQLYDLAPIVFEVDFKKIKKLLKI